MTANIFSFALDFRFGGLEGITLGNGEREISKIQEWEYSRFQRREACC
jgi:hypothetical protein